MPTIEREIEQVTDYSNLQRRVIQILEVNQHTKLTAKRIAFLLGRNGDDWAEIKKIHSIVSQINKKYSKGYNVKRIYSCGKLGYTTRKSDEVVKADGEFNLKQGTSILSNHKDTIGDSVGLGLISFDSIELSKGKLTEVYEILN